MHSDSAHLVLYIVRSSNAVDMKHYSLYQIEKFYDRQRSQDNCLRYSNSNLHIESRPMIINPTPFTVDEDLHKIGLLDSLWYSEQNVNSLFM